MYQISRLANGVTVATAEMPHMASVSVGLWVSVGGRHEPAELNGVSHFIEHMLFKGTRKRTAREISQAIEGIGGYLNAFTTEEMTCYYSKARHDRFLELLDVLMDMFLHSTFANVEIDKERNVIKEEVAMYLDQPQMRVQELLNETLWPDHPLGRPLTGDERTLDAIQRNDLVHYLHAHYVASKCLVSVAGRVRHREVMKAVARFASRFSDGKGPSFLPAVTQQTEPRVRLLTKDTEQTHLALGIRTCSRHDDRRYALRLLNVILGENMSSRLFQLVREDHGLAYSISSALNFFDDVGTLTVSAGLETDNLERVMQLIAGELQRFAQRSPTAGELRRARDYVNGQIDLGLEGTENRMMWLGEQLLGFGKITSPADIKRRLDEVTPTAIRAVARDFFHPDRMNLALVSPIEKTGTLEHILRNRTCQLSG